LEIDAVPDIRPASIVFDLDGTLADTAPDLAGAMNAVLREAGRPELPVGHVRKMVGRGARVLIETGFRASGGVPGEANMDAMFEHFIAHYRENIDQTTRLFPGARETVAALGAHGHRLGVCTNKPIGLAELLLERLDFLAPFSSVRGADSAAYRKPDARHFFDVVDAMRGDRRRSLLVGDSETDVKTARAAGVPVILVSFGYTEIPVAELGGDVTIDSFAELPAAISRLLD
jgi:phosphoglycolate phosphatase